MIVFLFILQQNYTLIVTHFKSFRHYSNILIHKYRCMGGLIFDLWSFGFSENILLRVIKLKQVHKNVKLKNYSGAGNIWCHFE